MRSARRWRGLVAAAGLAMAAGLASACATDDRTQVTVNIRRGSNFPEAAESLAAHGVIKSPRLFGIYASRIGRDRTIRYGMYLLERGASWNDVLDALEKGEGMVTRVRIIEGWALWDIVPELATKLEVPEESVLAVVRDTALLRRLGVPRGTRDMEGYLFPDTYDLPVGATARQAIIYMIRRFERVWTPEWEAQAAERKMTRHQVVTLASIVEKEVRQGSERPTVAGVYSNRLARGMLLQADPTIQYALQQRRPARVLFRDLRVDSPYNTYRRAGLPPGPIASPGAKSIEAALFPADVDFLYFVAHPDGHHEFRRTYREHLEAIRMVREVARRDTLERRRQAAQARVDSALGTAAATKVPATAPAPMTKAPPDSVRRQP